MSHPISATSEESLSKVTEGRTSPRQLLQAGPILLDLDRRAATVDGKGIALAPKEFALLTSLLGAKGRVLTREVILNTVWDGVPAEQMKAQAVDVQIGRLRRKLGDAGRYVITVRNTGYRFDICPDWIFVEPASVP